MGLRYQKISVTTTGSAGSASGNTTASSEVLGEIVKIYIDYNASCPNTADVTIASTLGVADETILVKSNSTTDAWHYPVRAHALNTDASALSDWSRVWVEGHIKVSVAQADALTDCVVVHIWYDERP